MNENKPKETKTQVSLLAYTQTVNGQGPEAVVALAGKLCYSKADILSLREKLSEEEISVYKRGRNTKVNTKAKNADMREYHSATGVEALFGYLYLQGDTDRIKVLFNKIWSSLT